MYCDDMFSKRNFEKFMQAIPNFAPRGHTILDSLKNHPMTYDDQLIRQILECVIVESKEQIKVVFIGGTEVIQPLD